MLSGLKWAFGGMLLVSFFIACGYVGHLRLFFLLLWALLLGFICNRALGVAILATEIVPRSVCAPFSPFVSSFQPFADSRDFRPLWYNTYCSTTFCSNRSIGKEKQQSFDCIKNDERKTWISNRASPLATRDFCGLVRRPQ